MICVLPDWSVPPAALLLLALTSHSAAHAQVGRLQVIHARAKLGTVDGYLEARPPPLALEDTQSALS